jgi:hypothetical protein
MKRIAIILAALLATAAHADEWHGVDKTQHAIGGAVIGAAVTVAIDDWRKGCAAAWVAGVGKEVADHYTPGRTVSAKDAIVTGLAGCLAAGGTQWLIAPTEQGVRVAYRWEF